MPGPSSGCSGKLRETLRAEDMDNDGDLTVTEPEDGVAKEVAIFITMAMKQPLWLYQQHRHVQWGY